MDKLDQKQRNYWIGNCFLWEAYSWIYFVVVFVALSEQSKALFFTSAIATTSPRCFAFLKSNASKKRERKYLSGIFINVEAKERFVSDVSMHIWQDAQVREYAKLYLTHAKRSYTMYVLFYIIHKDETHYSSCI